MNLREIFDRSAAGYHVEGGGLDETVMTNRTMRHVKFDYGEMHYIRTPQRESLWVHKGVESRIDVFLDGKLLLQVDKRASDAYLRRWLEAKPAMRPNVEEDGTVCEIFEPSTEEAIALIRATYCATPANYQISSSSSSLKSPRASPGRS